MVKEFELVMGHVHQVRVHGNGVSGNGFRVSGSGFRVPDLGFLVLRFGCRGLGLRLSELGIRVSGLCLGLHVQDLAQDSPRFGSGSKLECRAMFNSFITFQKRL